MVSLVVEVRYAFPDPTDPTELYLPNLNYFLFVKNEANYGKGTEIELHRSFGEKVGEFLDGCYSTGNTPHIVLCADQSGDTMCPAVNHSIAGLDDNEVTVTERTLDLYLDPSNVISLERCQNTQFPYHTSSPTGRGHTDRWGV
jgi:hypothetical protein